YRGASQQYRLCNYQSGTRCHSIYEITSINVGADTFVRGKLASKAAGRSAAHRPRLDTYDSFRDSRFWIARSQATDAGFRTGSELPRDSPLPAHLGQSSGISPAL